MEIVATAENLNYLLQISEILPSKPQDGKSGIEISAENETLSTTCLADDTIITRSLSGEDVKIKKSGNFTIQAKKVHDFVKKLNPEDNVTIKKNKNDVTIKRGKFNAKLDMQNITIPKTQLNNESSTYFTINSSDIKKMIRRVMYAVGAPGKVHSAVFTGVLFQLDKSGLTLVGTDAIELAVTSTQVESNVAESNMQGELNVVVPSKLLNSILSYIPGNEEITVKTDGKIISIVSNDTVISGSTLSGSFPNYKMAIPTKHESYFSISKAEFKKIIERAALLNEEKNPSINIKASQNKVQISKKSSSGQITDEIDAETENSTNIYLNTGILIDTIKAVPQTEDGNITIYIGGNKLPVKFEGESGSTFIMVPASPPEEENNTQQGDQENTSNDANNTENETDNDDFAADDELGGLDEETA